MGTQQFITDRRCTELRAPSSIGSQRAAKRLTCSTSSAKRLTLLSVLSFSNLCPGRAAAQHDTQCWANGSPTTPSCDIKCEPGLLESMQSSRWCLSGLLRYRRFLLPPKY